MEFTIQEGKLFILQTRSGKRTAASAVRIAMEMFDEGLLMKRQLFESCPEQLDAFAMYKQIDNNAKKEARTSYKRFACFT